MSTPVIAVCRPLAGQVHAATVSSLLGLDIPRPYFDIDRREVNVVQARNDIAANILFNPIYKDVTHLLWIDDDMVFAPDALKRLLAHDLPIVGGLCHGRRPPHYAPILCHKQPGGLMGYSYQHDYPLGLVEVDATGAAFILVKREVFETIEEAFPTPGEGPFTDKGHGEDISFCERAKECGYKIFVDTTLEIGHIGEVVIDSAFARKNRLAKFNPWYPPMPAGEGKPVASVIIPTWNQKTELLRAAVESALTQTAPVEVIVVDDGSEPPVKMSDLQLGDTPNESDERLRLIRHVTNEGCFAALNTGIKAMTTEWFTWLSSDDTWKQDKVKQQLQSTMAAGAKASCHGYDVLTPEGLSPRAVVPYQWRSLAEQQRVLSMACAINGLTAMIHKSVLDELGPFDRSFTISSDWELWNRVGQKYLWHVLPDLLATRRDFDGASERYAADPAKRVIWAAEDQRIREMYGPKCAKCGGGL